MSWGWTIVVMVVGAASTSWSHFYFGSGGWSDVFFRDEEKR